MSHKEILIVDDEADIRSLIEGILRDEGYATRAASNAKEAFAAIDERVPDLVILDIWLQGSDKDGMEILDDVKRMHPNLPVVMISGHGTIETAVRAIKYGAYDFIEKPFKSDRLLLMVYRALEVVALKRENEILRQNQVKQNGGEQPLIGSSSVMEGVRNLLQRIGKTNSRVLITGAPGSGKGVAAQWLHKYSSRSDKPFMVLNCATLRPEHLEIELFGCTEDTQAGRTAKTGLLQAAHGGTVFLDEVSDMPLETQGKILRALQENRFQKLGGQESIEVDVRFIASSNKDLAHEIKQGHFREDLYYRLNVVPIHVPSLSEHSTDIEELVKYFVEDIAASTGVPGRSISSDSLALMQAYHWPGNVRQLRNVIEWVLIMNGEKDEGYKVQPVDLPVEISRVSSAFQTQEISDYQRDGAALEVMQLPLRQAREVFEHDYLQAQIQRFGGNISKTAEFIGMERSALHRKIKTLEINLDSKAVESDRVPLKEKRA